jgi:hypothetical protein
MVAESILKRVPAAARYRRVAVLDSENALGPWREAATRLVEWSGDEAVWNRLFKNGTWILPEGDDARRVREHVEANRHALGLIDAGIQRGKLQHPECHSTEDFSAFLGWLPFLEITRLLQAKAIVRTVDGDFREAGEDLLRVLQFGELLCMGEGFESEYLSGLAIEDEAIKSLRRFAEIPDVPRGVRAELASELRRSLSRRDSLAERVRFGFQYFLICLDALPDTNDLEALADTWDGKYGDTLCRRDFLRVLDGHPRPFDKIATARLAGEEVADRARLLEAPPRPWWKGLSRIGIEWRRRRRRRWLRRQTAKWPGHQPTGVLFRKFLDDPELARKVHAQGSGCLGLKAPTDKEICSANRRLRRVNNPLGLLVLEESLEPDLVVIHEQQEQRAFRAKRELLQRLESTRT